MHTPTIICFLLYLLLVKAEITLFIKSVSKFPHFIGDAFSLDIQSRSENGKLSSDPSDTMVIRIVDLNFTEIERAYLVYGALYFIYDEFKGKLLDIKVWEKNQMSTKIDISIIFKRGAHKKYLEIFYFSAPNKFQQRKYMNNLSLSKRLFYQQIKLFLPIQLNLSMHPLNVDRKEIIINDMVMASCRVFGGIPQEKPRFEYHAHWNMTERIYNETANEIRMNLRASLRDHLTNFSCSAGNVTETFTIRIHHHPTALYIKPIIKKRLRSNSTIKCYTKEGYPDPAINWQLIEGPPNADRFYNFPGKGDQIHINSNSPTGSKWTFKCTMKSILLNSEKTLNKTISFAIAKNPMEICGEKCLNSRISEIEDSVAENGRLHEDIRLVLNQVKKQMIAIGKEQQETSRGLNASIKQVKQQMIVMGKEQQETFRRLNGSIKQMKEQMIAMGKEQQETSRRLNTSIKQVNIALNLINQIAMKGFNYTHEIYHRIGYQIPSFPSISPLSVSSRSYYYNDDYKIQLKFTNPQGIPANIDMKYKCGIFGKEYPSKIKYRTFDIKYRGASDMDSEYMWIHDKELVPNNFNPHVAITVTCNLLSYKYLP